MYKCSWNGGRLFANVLYQKSSADKSEVCDACAVTYFHLIIIGAIEVGKKRRRPTGSANMGKQPHKVVKKSAS